MRAPTETIEQVTAKEISERFHLPYSTINHYTDLGLFPVICRVGNKRMYNGYEVETNFREITRLAMEGYPLSLIRKKIMGLVKHELL